MYGYLYKSYGKDYRPKYDLCQRNRCIERGNVRNDGKAMRETYSDLKGNIRDYATINELICPSNMENLNAVFIEQDMSQGERLVKLNPIAIHQMSVLENSDNNERKLLKHEKLAITISLHADVTIVLSLPLLVPCLKLLYLGKLPFFSYSGQL